MTRQIFDVVYFFLPAGFANIAPVVLTKLLGAGTPVSERLFGSHKSWRGLILGTAVGWAVFFGQRLIDGFSVPMIAGLTMSAGALLGDLVKSFFKRLRGLSPGTPWIPFDQVDYIAGAILGTWLVVPLTARQVAIALIVYPLLHVVVSAAGHWLGLKERPI